MKNQNFKIALIVNLLVMLSSSSVYSSEDSLDLSKMLKDKNVRVSLFRQGAGLIDPRDTEGSSVFVCSATESKTTFGIEGSSPDTWEKFSTESVLHIFGLEPESSGNSLYLGSPSNDSQWFLIGNNDDGKGWLDIWSDEYDSVKPKSPFTNVKSSVSEYLISLTFEEKISEKMEGITFEKRLEEYRVNRASKEYTFQRNKYGSISDGNFEASVFMIKRATGSCVEK